MNLGDLPLGSLETTAGRALLREDGRGGIAPPFGCVPVWSVQDFQMVPRTGQPDSIGLVFGGGGLRDMSLWRGRHIGRA
jgi:hypothetical protein